MNVLRHAYDKVEPLGGFLKCVGINLTQNERCELPKHWLKNIFVCFDANLLPSIAGDLNCAPVDLGYATQIVNELINNKPSNSLCSNASICPQNNTVSNSEWVRLCQVIGHRIIYILLHKTKAIFKRESRCMIQITGEPINKYSSAFSKQSSIISTSKRATKRTLSKSQSSEPGTKRRKRNRHAVQSAINLHFPWPSKPMSKPAYTLYSMSFIYTNDLRERWPHFIIMTSNRSLLAKKIFGNTWPQCPQVDELGMALDRLIVNIRKCCLSALLRHYLPIDDVICSTSLPQLTATYCLPSDVNTFLTGIFRRITPSALIGANNTVLFVERCAKGMAELQKKDTFALHHFTNGLKSCFYVTDSQIYRNRLLFYRKPVWMAILRLAQRQFRDKCHLHKIKPIKVKQWKTNTLSTFGPFSLRFIPKSGGVRPIITSSGNNVPFMNWKLEPIKAILRCLVAHNPSLLGSSLIGDRQVHRKWQTFALNRRAVVAKNYMVKLDLEACFDKILQDKLLGLLNEIISKEGVFVLRKYTSSVMSDCYVKKKVKYFARRGKDHSFIPDYRNRKAVLTAKKESDEFLTSKAVMHCFKVFIKHHVISINGKLYLQKCGISQGSSISVILCNLYVAHMESTIFPHLMTSTNSQNITCVLLRHVDDFLLVTSDLQVAENFVRTLLSGVEEYNLSAKPNKTVMNFRAHALSQHDELLKIVENGQRIPWCAMLMCPNTLEVSLDDSRWKQLNARDMISLRLHCQPAKWFNRALTFSTSARIISLAVDTRLNDWRSVQTSIHQLRKISLKCAYAMHRQMKCVYSNCNRHYINQTEILVNALLRKKSKQCLFMFNSHVSTT